MVAETSRLSCQGREAWVAGWIGERRGVDSVGRANAVFSVVANSALLEIVSWGCPDIFDRRILSFESDLGNCFKDAGREG